jgi:sodium/proline symporter
MKDVSNVIRIISVLVIFCFIIPYSAAQFNAGAKGFVQVFDMTEFQGFFLTVSIVFIYTTLGGFFAVSYTDVVQSFFMILALVILPIVAVSELGGFIPLLHKVGAQGPNLVNPWAIGGLMIFGWIMIGLGSPGNPHILVRYMSIKKASLLKKSALIGTTWNVIMAWGAIFIGLAARATFPDINALDGDKENAFFVLAQYHLHPALVGFLMSALLAAIMSTCDSQLLVASSGIARDIFQKIIHAGEELSERTLVLVSRLSILFLVIFSIVIAQFASKEINLLVLLAWGGLGAGFGPQLLLSIYWKRHTLAGCAAGMLTGPIVTTLWELFPDHGLFIWMDKMYELVPGFFAGLIVAVIVSLFTKPPKGVVEK